MMDGEPLLSLRISAGYPGNPNALRDVPLEVRRGEILGLVGQSGCGKSTLALAILRLLHLKRGRTQGFIRFQGRDLTELKERELRRLRGREISLVLQSPIAALNPVLRIGTQLEEAWRIHRRGGTRDERDHAIAETLESVSLPSDRALLRRYASELSVGQAQRVLIAMAILHRPPLLIADEPTSALDIVTQAEILELFATLSRTLNMGILYISHDLLSVAAISGRVAVMNQGEIVECRNTPDLFLNPRNPYTRNLIAALPVVPRFPSAVNF
ncbi:MAG TPA: ABC transporter ATP-binding protein [Terracidiphilus sp.]|nr:ABC transporter ATP-binding protein [Terracidiphilus sp.]